MPPGDVGGSPQPSAQNSDRLPELEKEVGQDSVDLSKLLELAIAYYQAAQFEDAEATYLRMLAIERTSSVHNNLGNVYRDWGRTDLAVEQYNAAIESDPTSVNPWVNLTSLYSAQGDTLKARETAKKGLEKVTGPERERLERLLQL